MSSKDKDNKTLHDKLKQFFRLNKGSYIIFHVLYEDIMLNITSLTW